MKKTKIIFIFIFCSILILPLISFNIKTDQISEIDNRTLAEFPELNINSIGNFPPDFEQYFDDRIGYRDNIIATYTSLNDNFFGELVHPSYTYGQDGYIFFRPGITVSNFDFLANFANFIKRFQDYCEDRDIYFIYMLNPSKSIIYEEYLPKGYSLNKSDINFFISELERLKVNFYWSAPDLIELANTKQVYNKQFDAGHWNDIGAYFASSNLLNIIKQDFPKIEIPFFEDYLLTYEHKDSLPVSKFPISEEVPILTHPKYQPSFDEKYSEEIMIEKQYPAFSYQKNNIDSELNLLMFHGSYFHAGRNKFIAYPFGTFTNVHNYNNVTNYDYYINIFQPDIVIFSSTDYATNNTYFPTELLDESIYSAPLSLKDIQQAKKYSAWINHIIKISAKNQIIQTSLTYNKEIFDPIKAWCLLENNNKQFSTRIRQNTNNISEIQISLASQEVFSSNSPKLIIVAQDNEGTLITQEVFVEIVD